MRVELGFQGLARRAVTLTMATVGFDMAVRKMDASLDASSDALAVLCRQHHIRRLSLFGSVLKGTARPDSDIDLLVEFERGKEPGLLGIAQIESDMSILLGGRRVDLRTPEDLSRHFRSDVVRTARVQYAA